MVTGTLFHGWKNIVAHVYDLKQGTEHLRLQILMKNSARQLHAALFLSHELDGLIKQDHNLGIDGALAYVSYLLLDPTIDHVLHVCEENSQIVSLDVVN
jgi:hypothetical protein